MRWKSDLDTTHNVHEPEEAQTRSESTCVPTLKQNVNHQELSEAGYCKVGWSDSMFTPAGIPCRQKLPKEARPSVWRRRWRATGFLRSGAAGDCRCPLDSRVTFGEACERGMMETRLVGTKRGRQLRPFGVSVVRRH